MVVEKFIPFGRTGNVCVLPKPLILSEDTVQTEQNTKGYIRSLEYICVNKVVFFSKSDSFEFFEPIINLFTDNGFSMRFVEYSGLNGNNFIEDIELLDSIFLSFRKHNFAFCYTTEDEKLLHLFLGKMLLFFSTGTNVFDVSSYLSFLQYEKEDLKHLSTFFNFLKKDYYIFKQQTVFQIKSKVSSDDAPVKRQTIEHNGIYTDPSLNLVFTPLISTEESLLQNEDGTFKSIDFNINSLVEDGSGKSIHFSDDDDVSPENLPQPSEPVSPVLSKVDTIYLDEFVDDQLLSASFEDILIMDDIDVPNEDTNIHAKEFREKDIVSLIHTINKDLDPNATQPIISTDILNDIIDFSIDNEQSLDSSIRFSLHEEIVQETILLPQEPETSEQTVATESPKTVELIDLDTLIDEELEKELLNTEPHFLSLDTNILPETNEIQPAFVPSSQEINSEFSSLSEPDIFDINSLITDELESDSFSGDEETLSVVVEEPISEVSPVSNVEEEYLSNLEDSLVDIEALISEDLEPEDMDTDIDVLLDPTERNLDILIDKEIHKE
jgi:hypothetical protein